MEHIAKIIELLNKYHEKYIYHDHITVYGYQFNYDYDILGSVSKYYFPKLLIEKAMIDPSNQNRPGQKNHEIQYIVFHDTASTAEHAGALAHKNYVTSGDCKVSWHFSVGDQIIYRHLPDDEIAYHAGDGINVPFSLINTHIKYKEKDKTCFTVKNGFLLINDQATTVDISGVETIEQPVLLNDLGIRYEIIDGYYYVGPLYFNKTYQLVANRGGNLHSIGLETMVNVGSNLYQTWMNAAKLCAKLLLKYRLPLNRLKAHHFFSGKNCPMTMRNCFFWEKFLEIVRANLELLPLLSDATVTFKSLSPYLNDQGLLIQEPPHKTVIAYQVTIKHDDTIKTCVFESIYN